MKRFCIASGLVTVTGTGLVLSTLPAHQAVGVLGAGGLASLAMFGLSAQVVCRHYYTKMMESL